MLRSSDDKKFDGDCVTVDYLLRSDYQVKIENTMLNLEEQTATFINGRVRWPNPPSSELEIKYKELLEEHGSLSKKLEEIKNKEKLEERKQIEFSEKIDELNQETDTLLEEIDKWEM